MPDAPWGRLRVSHSPRLSVLAGDQPGTASARPRVDAPDKAVRRILVLGAREVLGGYGARVTEERWDVFISYGHVDGEWVRVLASNLHREAFDVFLDIWEVVGGDRVTGRLEEGIRGSRSGILVCSAEALARPWVIEEYEALLRQAVHDPSRRLIPVLLADAELPLFLGNRAWVDFRGANTAPLYLGSAASVAEDGSEALFCRQNVVFFRVEACI